MLSALAKAFGQLSDPAFRRVLVRSVLAALVVFIGVWIAAWFGLSWSGEALSDWVALEPGGIWDKALGWVVGAAGVVALLVASFLLFPAIMSIALSLMLEGIAQAVERRHYPELPPAREQSVGEAVKMALAFAAVMLLFNLLALPFYLLLMFLPPLNLFVFYLLNGYLLGREYFELVAARRFDIDGARRLRRKFRGRVMLAGAVITFLLTVPIVNLVTPVVATGFMLHVFERLRRREAGSGI
jgi:uncharacterized protein involved in cysteine biosynthesis